AAQTQEQQAHQATRQQSRHAGLRDAAWGRRPLPLDDDSLNIAAPAQPRKRHDCPCPTRLLLRPMEEGPGAVVCRLAVLAAEPSMTVLLSVQGLAKGFGPRPLFTDLSLDLRAGERVGLIGPNGSGKSTLLKLLAGCAEPDAGTRSLRRTARLGYVGQEDAFPAGQTARQAVLAALADEPMEEHERRP